MFLKMFRFGDFRVSLGLGGLFLIFWVLERYVSQTGLGFYLVPFLVIIASLAALAFIKQTPPAKIKFSHILAGLLVSEVYFTLLFWSTQARNKALILTIVFFFFYRFFDKIELTWAIVFLTIVLFALLLVPFQVL